MNKKIFLMACLPLALSACQQVQTMSQHIGTVMTQEMNESKFLSQYTWSYQPDTSVKPIVVSFQDKNFHIATGCNGQNGTWQLIGNTLKTSNLMSTMMMCSPDLMKQERFAQHVFGNSVLKVSFNKANINQPILIVQKDSGERYEFIGTMTPEARYKGQAKTVYFEVSPTLTACPDQPAKQCLQVREIQYNDQSVKTTANQWQTLNAVEGFQHNPQVKNVIRVKRFDTQNVQTPYAYIYDMTVEQEMIQ